MKKYTLFLSVLTLIVGLFAQNTVFAIKHNVNVGNYYFNPSSLNVTVGDTVRWVWVNGSHTTTSSTIPGAAASWDEPINNSNTSYEYKVTVAGTYNYVCTPHAGMGQVGSFTAAGAAPTLNVTPSNQNVTASAGNTSFDVTSNSNWTASSNAAWCTVTSSGSGNGSISATYTANASTSPRVATITVTVTGLPAQTVTVSQSGAAATLAVTPPNQNVTNNDGVTTFTVTSNTSWMASSNSGWCTVTPSGSGNGTITANFTENSGTDPRTAQITVTVAGLAPVVVTVSQDGTVGVGEQTLADLRAWPNPSTGSFTIGTKAFGISNISVDILDINGRNILSQECTGNQEYRFDLSGKPEGIYFLRIRSGDSSRVERMIIRK
jgi:plastocyanin